MNTINQIWAAFVFMTGQLKIESDHHLSQVVDGLKKLTLVLGIMMGLFAYWGWNILLLPLAVVFFCLFFFPFKKQPSIILGAYFLEEAVRKVLPLGEQTLTGKVLKRLRWACGIGMVTSVLLYFLDTKGEGTAIVLMLLSIPAIGYLVNADWKLAGFMRRVAWTMLIGSVIWMTLPERTVASINGWRAKVNDESPPREVLLAMDCSSAGYEPGQTLGRMDEKGGRVVVQNTSKAQGLVTYSWPSAGGNGSYYSTKKSGKWPVSMSPGTIPGILYDGTARYEEEGRVFDCSFRIIEDAMSSMH